MVNIDEIPSLEVVVLSSQVNKEVGAMTSIHDTRMHYDITVGLPGGAIPAPAGSPVL